MAVTQRETRLREARRKAGMAQVELASKAGVSVGKVNQYERGWFLPTLPTAKKLAEALSCEVEDLFDPEALRPF